MCVHTVSGMEKKINIYKNDYPNEFTRMTDNFVRKNCELDTVVIDADAKTIVCKVTQINLNIHQQEHNCSLTTENSDFGMRFGDFFHLHLFYFFLNRMLKFRGLL